MKTSWNKTLSNNNKNIVLIKENESALYVKIWNGRGNYDGSKLKNTYACVGDNDRRIKSSRPASST